MAIDSQGTYKSLTDLHYDFIDANKGLGGYDEKKTSIFHTGYCAFPALMKKTVAKYDKKGYDLSYKRDVVVGHSDFLSTVKKEISSGNPIVALSSRFYNYDKKKWLSIGHYFTIIGYLSIGTKTYVFFRDPYKKTGSTYWDGYMSSVGFWNMTSGQVNPNEMVLSIIGD